MRIAGDNFLSLCSVLGKLCLLSYSSFNLVLALNHPTEHLPAYPQHGSEFNSQQFPGLIFFFPCPSQLSLRGLSSAWDPFSFLLISSCRSLLSPHHLPSPLTSFISYPPLFLKIHHYWGGRDCTPFFWPVWRIKLARVRLTGEKSSKSLRTDTGGRDWASDSAKWPKHLPSIPSSAKDTRECWG